MELAYSIVPSLPAADEAAISALATAMCGVAHGLQIDLVDGQFVAAKSWPFINEERPVTAALAELAVLSQSYTLEFDCMVQEPEQYFESFVAANARRVIVHMGSAIDLDATLASARAHGFVVGIALTNDVPLSSLTQHIGSVDFVQLMGIAVIGVQGQPFDERTLERVAALRAAYPTLELAVDGGVNATTIPKLLHAGCNRFAPGSAITAAGNPALAFQELAALIPARSG